MEPLLALHRHVQMLEIRDRHVQTTHLHDQPITHQRNKALLHHRVAAAVQEPKVEVHHQVVAAAHQAVAAADQQEEAVDNLN
jgi:hypothetical protein